MPQFMYPTFVSALLLLSTFESHAYTISPKVDVHESITRAAKHCFDINTGSKNSDFTCPQELKDKDDKINTAWIADSSINSLNLTELYKRARGITARYPTLEEAVRWPDDPTRQIRGFSIGKFSVNMVSKCGRYVNDNRSGRNDINDGLLCNSHNGEMQFLHAQASRIGEAASETHYKIMSWSTFLYKVASGHLTDKQLDQPYCDYFSGDNYFHNSMLPNQQAVPCEGKKDPKWTLATLFTLKCSNPFSSVGCKEEGGPSKYVKARIYAAGALLHLIQDSYSQSHAERGSCERDSKDNKVQAKIECLPITMFTTYKGQVAHDDADRTPVFMKSCKDTKDIDNPITASAKILWHISKKSPIDTFQKDIERVFSSSKIMATVNNAGLGMCFDPKNNKAHGSANEAFQRTQSLTRLLR